MNKFIKLPLTLGSVCLIFCSTLALVVNVCEPVIEKNEIRKENAAYKKLYTEVDVDNIQKMTFDETKYNYINSIALVSHSNVESYVYVLTTRDPMSGKLKFMLGLEKETGAIDSYCMVSNENGGYATYYDDNEVVLKDLKDDNKVTSSKQTLTQKAVQECIDMALNHYSETFGGEK